MRTWYQSCRRTWAARWDEAWLVDRVLWATNQLAMHAGYFDDRTANHARSLLRMRQVMAEAARVCPAERVLDAGCGVGGTSLWLARTYGARVVALDLSRARLGVARRHAARAGLSNRVSLVRGDLRGMGLASEHFDVIWAQESINLARGARAFLREALRLLRPGGRLIAEEFFEAPEARTRGGGAVLDAFCAGCATSLMTAPGFAHEASAAGFDGVATRDVTVQVMPSLQRQDRLRAWTWPAFVILDHLGLREPAQRAMRAGLGARRQALARGWLRVHLCTAVKPAAA